MFGVILLLVLPIVLALDRDERQNDTLNEFGFSPTDNSLMGQFLSYISVNTYRRSKSELNLLYFVVLHRISYLPEDVIQNEPLQVAKLLNNMFPLPDTSQILPRILAIVYGTFQHFISNIPLRKYENKDWILRVWNPFYDNITGLAVYDDVEKGYRIEEVYNNQTENDIEMNKLKLAGFIPGEFLKKLSEGKSDEELQDVTVRMLIILNGKKFAGLRRQKDDIQHLIGISIPGYCKNDRVPFLKAHLKYAGNDSGDWMDFGSRYIDDTPEFIKQLCLLSHMVFFGRIDQNKYYDSVLENHCVIGDSGIITPIYFLYNLYGIEEEYSLPRHYCSDEYQIPFEECTDGEIVYNNKTFPPCQRNFPYPDRTRLYYELLKYCSGMRYGSFCSENLSFIMNSINSFDEAIIAMNFRYVFTPVFSSEMDRVYKYRLDLIEKLLIFAEKEERQQVTKLITLVSKIIEHNFTHNVYTSPHLTCLTFGYQSDIVGFIIYKSNTSSIGYEMNFLSENNATLDYSSDPTVKVIAFVTKLKRKYHNGCRLFVLFGNFVEYANHTLRSDVVGVDCPFEEAVLHVYLSSRDKQKAKEYYENEGYSSIINLKHNLKTTIYIFELKDTICDPTSKLAIFDEYIPNSDLNFIHSGNLTYRNYDLLSHLAITVDASTEQVVEGQSTTLKSITFILSSLSLFGVLTIILSAVFLKNWYQQRPYSIQLTISVMGATIFFLISESYVNQIGYIVFYYFLLSQFIWMLIIGYLQYIRYVKIFESFELNILRTSLVGWIVPIAITSISILFHLDCLRCNNICTKNRDILMHFFIIPISIVIVSNTVLYTYVMVMIARSDTEKFEPDTRKARRKATLFLPSILGISWIFFVMLFIPNLGVSTIGTYIFHVIASSQGLMIFIFVVLFDKNTLMEWYQKCCCIQKRKDVPPIEVAFHVHGRS